MREFRVDKIPQTNVPSLPDGFTAPKLDLEIGAGQGLHAIQYCLAHPERRLIALERTQNKFAAFHARLAHHPRLSNLLALRSDAQAFAAHRLNAETLDRVFLLYPNPYPKPKQANLRWHRSPFIRFLATRLKPHGQLFLATNLKWYADEAEDWLSRRDPHFRLVQRTELRLGARPRTHFEKKYLERGETCFDLIFERCVQ